ncbi:glycosyltransferase family protein [Frateuria aurantia]
MTRAWPRPAAGEPVAAGVGAAGQGEEWAGLAADRMEPVAYGLILVLYRPQHEHLKHLLTLSAQCPCLVVVDNTEAPDPGVAVRLEQARIPLLRNFNQGGLAGAYNRGADWLQARSCELMFLLDQDSVLREGFFEAMLGACAALHGTPFIVGPKIYETQLDRYMPALDPAAAWPRPVALTESQSGLVPSLCVISSGSAISMAAWQRMGRFREDYFIEYIDVEYALRGWHLGVPAYVNTAAVLEQKAGAIVRHGRHYSTHHPAWRRYYMARNAVHALRCYPRRHSLLPAGLLLLCYQALGVACFETGRCQKLLALLIGLSDGLRGRLGRLEDRHPVLAARWRRV